MLLSEHSKNDVIQISFVYHVPDAVFIADHCGLLRIQRFVHIKKIFTQFCFSFFTFTQITYSSILSMQRKRNITTLSNQYNTKRITRFQPHYGSNNDSNASSIKSSSLESTQIAGFGRHTLGLAPPNITKLTPQAQKKLASNPNARLGLDVCMICASKLKTETEVVCPHCGGKVAYCSLEHRALDRKIHKQVCPYLAMIDEDQRFEDDFPNATSFIWKNLVPLFFDVPQAFRLVDESENCYSSHEGANTEENDKHANKLYRCARVNLNANPRLWQWESLLFAPMRARFASKAKETMEGYRTTKREDDMDALAEGTVESVPQGDQKEDITKTEDIQGCEDGDASKDLKKFLYGDWNAFEAKKECDSWVLPASATLISSCLRVATASLANPLTIAQTIGTNPSLFELVKRLLVPENRDVPDGGNIPTLTLHLIGASEHECHPHRLPFWSALPAALSALFNLPLVAPGNDVEKPQWRIQILFVGLEMPEVLFSSSFNRNDLHGLSPHLDFAFFEGMYDDCIELLDAETSSRVNMSPPTKLPSCPPANSNGTKGTTSTKESQPIAVREATGRWSFVRSPQGDGFALSWGYPTLLCGFQMGLTVPEYSWRRTLQTMNRMAHSSRWNRYTKLDNSLSEPNVVEKKEDKKAEEETTSDNVDSAKNLSSAKSGNPPVERDVFLLTTSSSEEEAILESQILTRGHRFASIVIASPNPLRSLQPLQSGTLGNDVWSKNVSKSLYQLSTLF